MRIRTVAVAALLISFVAITALARTWTDSTGTYKIEGEFVKLSDGKVEIRRDDGKLIRIPLDKLSEDDRKFARKAAKPAGDETPFAIAGDDEKPVAKPAEKSDNKDTQTVFAEGVGTTKEEALKDAFRAAVRQVVGEVVDGETLVKNEELVKDQVLTYSDGFIPEHKVTSDKHENGIFRVGIQAKVQRRSVVMKLKAAKITLKNLDGQSLYGNIVTQVGAEKDAAALVVKALEGFPDNCLEARVVGEPKTLEKTDSEATLAINVEFAPSLAGYNTFASKFCQTLEGSSKVKGEFSSVAKNRTDGYGNELLYFDGYDAGFAKWMPELWKGGSFNRRWTPEGIGIAVATLTSKDASRMEWKYYILDESTGDAVVRAFTREATCKVSFLDAEGQLVFVERFDPRADIGTKPSPMQGILMSPPLIERQNNPGVAEAFSGRRLPGDSKPKLAFVAPVFWWRFNNTSTDYVSKFTIPRTIKLSLDEVKRVAKVKCELTFRAGNDDEKKK